jgi:hypothetical protein
VRHAEAGRALDQPRLAERAGGETDLRRATPARLGEHLAQPGAADDEAAAVALEAEARCAVTLVVRQPSRQTVDLAVIDVEPTPVQADRGQATACLS